MLTLTVLDTELFDLRNKNTTKLRYFLIRWILHSINGVVIPGGDAEIQPGHPFYDAFTIIIEISEQVNRFNFYLDNISLSTLSIFVQIWHEK